MAISKALVRNLLKKNMPKLGDGYVDCIYTPIPLIDYDSTDGSFSDSEVLVPIPLNAVISSFRFSKNQSDFKETGDSSVQDKDKKALVEARFLNGVEVKKDDLFEVVLTSIIYNVVGANIDPYDGAYTIHLRPIEE